MKPKIIDKEQMALVGMVFYGDPFKEKGGWSQENEIGKLWKRFMAKEKQVKNRIGKGAFEVHIGTEEYEKTKNYYVFVGVEVEKIDKLPPEMFAKILPPAKYAVFTLKGKEITSDWNKTIFKDWLPKSGYKEAQPITIEYYDDRFKGTENIAESELDIYVPLKKAG
jgi:AraC family transcriptional regulator